MATPTRWGTPADVLRLGRVSLLTDISSEMIVGVFALCFTTVAGGSTALLGLVEGLADAAAASLDFWAGWWSDRNGRRKPFALAGYGWSTLMKSLLLASPSVASLATFRVLERLGKSVRGPPRDAWLAAIAPEARRGYAFGVHTALDKAGAVIGPLIAYGVLAWRGATPATYALLFALALIPALASVLVLARVAERRSPPRERAALRVAWRALSPQFKRYLLPAGLVALGYFSVGFLFLRARAMGFAVQDVVLLYGFSNGVAVISAPLIGRLGDGIGRGQLVVLSYLSYALVCLGFAWTSSPGAIIALFGLYGGFTALDEAQSKAFIADLEPTQRGMALGIYNAVTGALYLVASLWAGLVWAQHAQAAFITAAALGAAALAAWVGVRPDRPLGRR